MVTETLDRWLPDPAIRTRHERRAHAPADVLWAAAERVRLADTRTLGRLVRWRIPGTPADQTFSGLLATYPFTVLESGAQWSLSGLVGRIWTLQRDYPVLHDAAEFRAWRTRGTVRVLFASGTVPDGDGSRFVMEARVDPVDRRAGLRLRGVWAVLGGFERLIGAEPLGVAVREAEAAAAG